MPLLYRPGVASKVFWVTMVFVLSLLWGGVFYVQTASEAKVLASAESDVRNLSLAFAEHTRASFQRVDTLLLQLRKAWIKAPAAFGAEVQQQQAAMGELAFQVGVIGADGRLDYSNLAFARERIDLSDREHFRAVRDYAQRQEDRLFISAPLKGRVSGRWSIQFARPVFGPSGFDGVMVLSIDPGYFSRFYGSIDLGPDAVVSMVRDSGEVLSRAPDMELALGKLLTGTPYLTPGAPDKGTFLRSAQIDGTYRLYGYRRLAEYGVTLVVGIDAQRMLAEVRRQHRLELIGAAAVSVVLLLMMIVVGRAQAAEFRSGSALAQSEEKLRRVQQVMPAGLVVIDGKGHIVDCNLAAERILRMPRSKLLSRSIATADWNAVHPNGRPMAPQEFPGAMALRERCAVLDVEMGVCRNDAQLLWLMVSATPMDDDVGTVVIVFTDITERKRHQQMLVASEKRFRTLFGSFTEIVFVVDTSGRFSMVHLPRNVQSATIDTDAWVGRAMAEVLPAEVATVLSTAVAEALADSETRTVEVALALTGDERRYQVSISLLQGDAAWPEGFVLVLHDVTAERAVAEAQRVAATTFESQEGMMITDGQGIILRVNRAFSDLTGYAPDEVVGHSPSLLKSGRQGADFYQEMWASLLANGYWQGEVWNRRKGGEVFPEWLTISAVNDDEGRTTHYVGAFSDITERKEAEERIRKLAFYDPLTTLPNRRLLLDRLHQALAASERMRTYGAILYIDLDHFKLLNDTRGHDAGDELLIQMGERLRSAVREQDTVARLGGDEFVVMLEDLGPLETRAASQAGVVAEKIRSMLGQPFVLSGGDHTLTPSIGISVFHGQELDVQTLMKQADMALYEAKEQGRNAVRFFSHDMQEMVSAQAAIVAGLRRGLQAAEFELHFQPQFDVAGRRTGAEALLRWQPPGGALMSPEAFIPHAEASGLIVPLGAWVLDQACATLAVWQEQRPQECLSVNVSARQFHQPDFVEVVAEALARHGVDGARLCLELTETTVLGDVAFAARTMQRLKQMGVTISLDDFGTGYSSLSNLRRLPIDEVKIDRSFVQEIVRNEQDAAIVRAIISMCGNLGLRVVAEGVESEAQKAFLVACRCDRLQGYLLGRPQPLATGGRAPHAAAAGSDSPAPV